MYWYQDGKMDMQLQTYKLQWPQETWLSSWATQPPCTQPSLSPCHGWAPTPGTCFTLCQAHSSDPGRARSTTLLNSITPTWHLGTAPIGVSLKLPRSRLSPVLPAAVCAQSPQKTGRAQVLLGPNWHLLASTSEADALTLTYLMHPKTSWCLKAFQYKYDNTRE